jgi:hypothetical protein
MKSVNRALRDVRKFGTAMALAGTNSARNGGLAVAAGEVIAKRMALGAAALVDPMNADHGEFAKMIPEKTAAFSAAGLVWLQWSARVTQQMAVFAANEAALAAQAGAAMASCRTPADLAAAQGNFAMAWFSRALSQSVALGSMALRSQAAAIAPVHRSATANARRLRR